MNAENIEKGTAELAYWRRRKIAESDLSNGHYGYFYTTHFDIHRDFYQDLKILDLGCGPRGSLEWAIGAAERVGLDPLATSYLAMGAQAHKMTYVAGSGDCIPYPDGHFDVISSFNSLDHVDDLDRTIDEIIRVLSVGGTFLLLTNVNHAPTVCEPQCFGFEIVSRLAPPLVVVTEQHFEFSRAGMYESLRAAIPYNHAMRRRRMAILSARFEKRS